MKKVPPLKEESAIFDPLSLLSEISSMPVFHTRWEKVGEKRRLISNPNGPMRRLHELFKRELSHAIWKIGEQYGSSENYTLRKLPSATGSVPSSNHFVNAEMHMGHRFFYITDIAHAYPSVDLDRLTKLLTLVFRYESYQLDSGYSIRWFASNPLAQEMMISDPMYDRMREFVRIAFAGAEDRGLAIGGPLSPYLLNLYCEVFVDSKLRKLCERVGSRENPERNITYTRYVDDLVFSRDVIISSDFRKEIRSIVESADFSVNHRKSKVLDATMGTVFVTKVGIEGTGNDAVIRFPKEKRRRLEGIIRSYLSKSMWNDSPEVIRGLIAEFLYYLKHAAPTESDKRLRELCKQFQHASHRYRKRYRNKKGGLS